jgi:hypothetical protein
VPSERPQRWTLERFKAGINDGRLSYWVRLPVWVGD